MTKKNLPAMVLSLIFFSAAAAAGGITLEQAVETAIANNGDLQKTASAFQQAKRAKDYGWNQILSLPSAFQVGVSNTHQIFGDSGSSAAGAGGSAGGSNWPLGGQLTLGARFQFSTDTRGQLRQVDLAYRRAGEAYEKAVRDLSGDVAASFYSLLASRLNIAILETDLELKNAQYEQENANYRRGLASELDMLNAQYAYLSAGPALTAAVSKYGEDLAAFFLLLGLDAGPAGTVGPNAEGDAEGDPEPEGAIEIRLLDLPAVEELTLRYLMNHSVVKNQTYALEQAKLSAASGVNKLGPALNVSETFTLSANSKSGFNTENPALSGVFSVSVSIPLGDLLPFSPAGIVRKNDQDNLALAAAALESAKKEAAQDIQKKVNAVAQNAAAIESSDLNHRIAARAYELTEQGYRSGLASQTELQLTNQRMVNAEQSTVTAKIAYLTAVYNLASALSLDITDLYELYAKE